MIFGPLWLSSPAPGIFSEQGNLHTYTLTYLPGILSGRKTERDQKKIIEAKAKSAIARMQKAKGFTSWLEYAGVWPARRTAGQARSPLLYPVIHRI